MRNMKRVQQGFTLIELMIVIAIVAILVALAVPAYQDYTIRAKVGECVNAAAVPKLAISEYAETAGTTAVRWPPDASTAGITTAQGDTTFCDGYTNYDPDTGSFDIAVNEGEVGSTISPIEPSMIPTYSTAGGHVEWNCVNGNTDTNAIKYLPSSCREDS